MGPPPSGYFPCEVGITFKHPAGVQCSGEGSALPPRTSGAQSEEAKKSRVTQRAGGEMASSLRVLCEQRLPTKTSGYTPTMDAAEMETLGEL